MAVFLSETPDALPDAQPVLPRLALTLGGGLAGMVAGTLLGGLLASAIWRQPPDLVPYVLTNPDQHPFARGYLLVLMGFATLGAFVIGPLYVWRATMPLRFVRAWLTHRLAARPLGGPLAAVALLLAAQPLLAGMVTADEWLQRHVWHLAPTATPVVASAGRLTELLNAPGTWGELVASLLVLALITGFGEEVLLRGVVQPTLGRWLPRLPAGGIWLTAALLLLLNFSLVWAVPRLVLALTFGALYWWSGRLAVPIAAHAAHNAVPLVLAFLFRHGLLATDFSSAPSFGRSWVAASAVVVAVGVPLLRRYLLARRAPLVVPPPPPGRFTPSLDTLLEH